MMSSESFMNIFNFGGKKIPQLDESDKIIIFAQSIINRRDLLENVFKKYEHTKNIVGNQRNIAYLQIYLSLENFIINNKPLVVQKKFTKDELRSEIRKKVDTQKLPIVFGLLFLPENEQLLTLYEHGSKNLSHYLVSQLGTQGLQKIVTSIPQKNEFLTIAFHNDDLDFTSMKANLGRITEEDIISFFKALNKELYQEIDRLLGTKNATDILVKNYNAIKEMYDYDLISKYLEVMPEGILDKERVAFLTREELEKRAMVAAEEDVRRELAEKSAEELRKNVEEQTKELKKEKEAMATERNKLSVVLSGITDAVVAIDADNKIILCNSSAEHIIECTENEMLDKNIDDIVILYEDDHVLRFMEYRQQTETMKATLKQGIHLQSKEGKNIFIEVFLAPVVFEDQNQTGWILTFHDITKEQELEQMKLDFVSMAAHELRTPLTSIKGYTSLLYDEYFTKLDEAGQMYLNRLTISTKNLGGLIENLLNVSRIEKDTFKVELAPIQLGMVIADVIVNLEEQAHMKKQILSFHSPQNALPEVFADSARIMQVLTNLIANAINYTQEGGIIEVFMKQLPKYIEVSIKDNGQGIPKEALPKLFTKFFRVSGILEQGSKGTGLGLFITKSIVNMHHGDIIVESEEGKGATFRFTVPIASKEEVEENNIYKNKIGINKKGMIYNNEMFMKRFKGN